MIRSGEKVVIQSVDLNDIIYRLDEQFNRLRAIK